MNIITINKPSVLKRLLWLSLLMGLMVPALLQASPGISVVRDDADFASSRYRETAIDLRVKVLGGFIEHQRLLTRGVDWQFNPAWQSLAFQYALDADPSIDLPTVIRRNTFSYKPVGSQSTPTYVFDERKWIVKTATGWRWHDRLGNRIDYDPTGKIVSYSDRNNVTVSFTRDVEGRIETIKDHHNTVVLTYSYNAISGKLEKVSDYTDRSVSYTYDAAGHLDTVTDVRGQVWRYGYFDYDDGIGFLLISITDPEANPKSIGYTVLGGMICVESTGGVWVFSETRQRWEYQNARCTRYEMQPRFAILSYIGDGEGQIYRFKFFYNKGFSSGSGTYKTAKINGISGLQVKTFNGKGEVLEESKNGELVSKLDIDGRTRKRTDKNGKVTTTQHDQWRNPIKVTYPDNRFISREYDVNFTNITRYTDEKGVITKYDYDTNGNLLKMTEALGLPEQRITEYDYDAFGNRTLVKTLADAVTAEASVHMSYDAYGNLKTFTDAEGHVTEYLAHDALGKVLQMKDARTNIWKYDYDPVGNLTREQTPLAYVTAYGYDKVGNLTSITDAHLKITGLGYDKRNRVKTVTNPLNETSTLAYNGSNQLTAFTNALNQVMQFGYDKYGQLIRMTDPSGNVATLDYGYGVGGVKGLINRINYPTYQQNFSYDERYRLKASEESGSDAPTRLTAFSYDTRGNLKTTTDANQRATELNLDNLSRTTGILDTAQQLTQLAYDNRNNLIEVTNARTVAIRQYQYDKNDRLLKELLPDGLAILQQNYDPNGNLKQTIDAKGQVASYTYDKDNRLTQVQYFSDIISAADPLNAQKTVGFGYDNLNRLTAYDDGTSTGTYSYDDAGQLTSSSVNYGSFTLSQSYTYYPSGLKKTYTGPDNIIYSYSYDAGGQLQSISIPGQGNYTVNQYQWNQPEQVTLPGGGKLIVDYDGYMRSKRLQGLDPASNPVMDNQYGYDLLDNILNRNSLDAEYVYNYDEADRLTDVQTTAQGATSSTTHSYSYDAVGNRETDSQLTDAASNPHTWVYDDHDRLKQRGAISYDYDANGSQITRTNADTGEIRHYVYNLENRLSEVRDQSNILIASYSYDPFGRRLSKTANGTTTYYFYNQEGLVAEADVSGGVTTTYGYQPNSLWGTNPLFIKQGGQFGYYINDHLGTPQRVVAANGAVLWSGVYDAFGGVVIGVASLTNNLRFAGQYFDGESGLYYNYFRYYDAEIGRYITSDPIGLDGGVNAYGYVLNNPLKNIDSLGLWTIGISFNVGGGAGFGGTVGNNFVLGYGANGFSFDIQRIVGAGAYAGANGGFSVNLEISEADSTSDLCGIGFQAGGAGGQVVFVDGNVFGGEGYVGYSLGLGIGGGATPIAGYGYATHTSSITILQLISQ